MLCVLRTGRGRCGAAWLWAWALTSGSCGGVCGSSTAGTEGGCGWDRTALGLAKTSGIDGLGTGWVVDSGGDGGVVSGGALHLAGEEGMG